MVLRPLAAGAGDRLAATIVLRPPGRETSEASCDLIVRSEDAARVGDTVTVRATPVAWGTVKTRDGRPLDKLVLACASAVRAPAR